MDNVQELRNLTAHNGDHFMFKVYSDPVFETFEDGIKYFQPKNEYLTINVSFPYYPVRNRYQSWLNSLIILSSLASRVKSWTWYWPKMM